MRLLLLFLSSIASSAGAADDSLSFWTDGPLLGFVYDPSAAVIRTVHGVPGAALLDNRFDPGFSIATAAVSPAQDSALAASATDGLVRLIHLDRSSPAKLVQGAMSAPERIVYSAGGSSALLYASGPARLQVVTRLPDRPTVRDVGLEGSPAAMAVSDDGALILLSCGDDDSLLALDGDARRSFPLSAAVLAVRRGGHDAIAVGRSGNIYSLLDGGATWYEVHYAASATLNATAAQLSADGSTAYIASASGGIAVLRLDTGESNVVNCGCTPVALEPMNSPQLFRLTGPATSPLWLLNVSESRLWFVPPGRPE